MRWKANGAQTRVLERDWWSVKWQEATARYPYISLHVDSAYCSACVKFLLFGTFWHFLFSNIFDLWLKFGDAEPMDMDRWLYCFTWWCPIIHVALIFFIFFLFLWLGNNKRSVFKFADSFFFLIKPAIEAVAFFCLFVLCFNFIYCIQLQNFVWFFFMISISLLNVLFCLCIVCFELFFR